MRSNMKLQINLTRVIQSKKVMFVLCVLLTSTMLTAICSSIFLPTQCHCNSFSQDHNRLKEISINKEDDQKNDIIDILAQQQRIMKHVRSQTLQMWNSMQYELNTLKVDVVNESKIDAMIARLRDRHMHIQAYLELERETHSHWQEPEAQGLRMLLRSQLQALQNPGNCSQAFFLKSTAENCGFGCMMLAQLSGFVQAIGDQRVFVFEFEDPVYGSKDLSSFVQPLSPTCQHYKPKEQWMTFKSDEDSHDVRIVKLKRETFGNTAYVGQNVPDEISVALERFHDYPYIWWSGILLDYLMRLKPWVIAQMEIDITRDLIVGVHVRRSDKLFLNEEYAVYHHFSEYMVHVEEWFRKEEIKQTLRGNDKEPIKRRVYLATDDPGVWKEAKRDYPNYVFLGSEERSKRAKYLESRYTSKGLVDIIADINMLSRCSFLVCTLSSEVCKMSYQLMQTRHSDASANVHSLDFPYTLDYQAPRMQLVKFDHVVNEATNEMELKYGDEIQFLTGNQNGYFTGKNTRTKDTGFYPSYKVETVYSTFQYAKRQQHISY